MKGCQKAFVQLLNDVLVCFSYMPWSNPSWVGQHISSGISGVYSDCQDIEEGVQSGISIIS